MRPNRLLAGLLLVLLLALAGGYAARAWLGGAALTACEALPILAEAERIVAAHEAELREIEALSVSVSLDGTRCPGRAELLIAYATAADRAAIEAVLDDTFFGLPYRLMNV